MPQLQGRYLPQVQQESPLVRRTPLLEDPQELQGLPVLRLGQQAGQSLHLPGFRGLRVLTKSTLLQALPTGKALLPAAGLGVLIGALARGSDGIDWIFALLVCSAVVTAIAQQTLP